MNSPFVLPVEVSTLKLEPGILIKLSMSTRSLTVLDLNGKTFDLFLNTKYYDKSFISYAKSALQDDVLIPICYCKDNEYGEVICSYYTDTDYSMFESDLNIKVSYLRSVYDLYISSLQDVDTFELPDLTPEELRIVDELNESLYDMEQAVG